MFLVQDIENITSLSSRDFFFEYSGTKFHLRAQTEEEKEIWIEALRTLISFLQDANPATTQSTKNSEIIT